MKLRGATVALLAVAIISLISIQSAHATPYASGVVKSGTSVSFILNEPADSLTYSINGGAPVALNGAAKGTKTFTLNAPTDTFSISAEKTAATGYTIPTGNVSQPVFGTPGPPPDYSTLKSLSQPTNESGYNLISDDANPLTKYNSPRGVSVSRDPNAPNFGTVYISNSATPATFAARPGLTTAADGLYALHSDQSDAFGYGDTAQNPIVTGDVLPAFSTASSSSPYRLHVAKDGTVYEADWADVNSNAFSLNPNMTTAQNLFVGYDGTTGTATGDGTSLPVGQNHGSPAAIYTEGSLATGDLVVYTIDEDLTSAHVSGNPADPQNDRNSLWKYTIGSGPLPTSAMPTKVFGGPTGILGNITTGGIVVDMDRGADGKFYISQQRTAGNEPGLIVVDSSGNKLFDSLATSRTMLNDPAAHDIITTLTQIAI